MQNLRQNISPPLSLQSPHRDTRRRAALPVLNVSQSFQPETDAADPRAIPQRGQGHALRGVRKGLQDTSGSQAAQEVGEIVKEENVSERCVG